VTGVKECEVTVINDIVPGKIAFDEPVVEAKQSDECLKIPVWRTERTDGKLSPMLSSVKHTVLVCVPTLALSSAVSANN